MLSILLSACVSESVYQKVVDERNNLSIENENLKTELEEIKFGAPNLLSDGKQFYEAEEKFQTLVTKHPDMPQTIEAKKDLANIDEEELWQNALNSEEMSYTENYIENYPKGKYISKANSRKSEIKQFNLQKAYDDASNSNSSYAWKKFLEEYPNYNNANSIKEKIIRLEVDEILGDRETGQMPSFDNYGSSYSANFTVEITNNTGCSLTVRDSGSDARVIEIPTGGIRKVHLSSGSYKIAASACGANYAGTENLQGSYGSAFYISTSRY